MSRLYILRVFWITSLIAGLFLIVTKPQIEDYVRVHSIEVVALSNPEYTRHGCVVAGIEKTPIEVGDKLYVKPDIQMLKNNQGQYRTHMVNSTLVQTVYNDQAWSQEFPYSPERKYCKYQTLAWWIGREKQPELIPAEYTLFTEYQFILDNTRTVDGQFPSTTFKVESQK